MLVVYENSNDEYKLYVGEILTSFENFERQGYMDIDTLGGGQLKHLTPDWKNSHINSASEENVKGFYNTMDEVKHDFAEVYLVN